MATSLRPILNGPSAPMRVSLASSSSAAHGQGVAVGRRRRSAAGVAYRRTSSSAPLFTRPCMASTPEVMTDRSNPAENLPSRPSEQEGAGLVLGPGQGLVEGGHGVGADGVGLAVVEAQDGDLAVELVGQDARSPRRRY